MDFQLNLRDESVTQSCLAEPMCCTPDTPLTEVIAQLRDVNTGAALICDGDGKLAGIFTERDALKLMANGHAFDGPISEVMTTTPATLPASASIADAISLMSSGGYRRLPVLDDDGKPVGIVKTSVLVRFLVEHFPEVVYNLPPDPHHVTQQREGA